MAGKITEVSDSEFGKEVLESDGLVLVDFWAPWCAPCKSIAPVLEEVAAQFGGKLKVAKVNIDNNPESPSHYNVRSIPNLVFFKGGQVVEQIVGAIPKDQLVETVSRLAGA